MRRKNKILRQFLAALLLVGLFHACDFFKHTYPPPEPPPQTQILRIDIIPNDTLAPGDTATFRCVIADSLDTRFIFTWGIDKKNGTELIKTDTNSIQWVAPKNSKIYTHNVSVNNGSKDSTSVFQYFDVYVRE